MDKRVEKLIEAEEYEEALALMSQLSIQDAALEALLLIKSEEYEKALAKGITGFEAAYCHYRLGDFEKALSLLNSEKRSLILKGQIYYKTGKYEEAHNTYAQVLKSMANSDERKNVLINFWACKAALAWSSPTFTSNNEEFGQEVNFYEIMYNRGIEVMAQDKEDACLLFKAAAGILQRDGEQVDKAVQYNLDLCLGKSKTSNGDSISSLNEALFEEKCLNKAVRVVKKEVLKRKLPFFQRQLAIEHLIIRAVNERKYHTAFNLSKLCDSNDRIQPFINLAIKKCRSLKNVPLPQQITLTLTDLKKILLQ